MGFSIRKANHDDVKVLCALGAKTFEETFAHLNTEENMRIYLADAFSEEHVSNELKEPNSFFYLVANEKDIIAYCKLCFNTEPEELKSEKALEINRFYVDQPFLGKGIAQQMMNACLSYAKENDFTMVWLGVWDLNPRAIRFYEKYGFTAFGRKVFMMVEEVQYDTLMKRKV